MHNKSLTADGLYSIVGGRNIGDEYFAATLAVNFSDMDLLMAGPVVQEIGAFFDMYWNSKVVYPISALVEASHASAELPALPLRSPSAAEAHENGGSQSRTYWARAVAIADPPDKLHQKMDTERYAIAQMRAEFERAEREMVLISPYFVPGKQGVRWLADAVKRGVRVRVLTNSFAATDVSVVHAGYARYRHDLLRAGVELYELKPTVPDTVVEKSTTELAAFFETWPLEAPALFGVSWAGEMTSEGWFDVGREFTELFHHQDQIRQAVGAPSLTDPRFAHAVIEIAVRGLPRTARRRN